MAQDHANCGFSSAGDKDVKFRENAKEQDGTSGGGVGVAEMRERKMAGQGLPSPQVSSSVGASVIRSGIGDAGERCRFVCRRRKLGSS